LGGGGFFLIEISPRGMMRLEAAIEFGGKAEIDIGGLANGSVYIMAGYYFSIKERCGTKVTELAGYMRCGGNLTVIGLIEVSLVFYLELKYFFSVSVELTVSKKFLGDGNAQKVAGECSPDQLALDATPDRRYAEIASLNPVGLFSAPPQDQKPKTFSEVMKPDQWSKYCDAFAA
jgi:hypothetical protein